VPLSALADWAVEHGPDIVASRSAYRLGRESDSANVDTPPK
jgi:hypothetical protein